MTAAPAGQSKAAAENTDAAANLTTGYGPNAPVPDGQVEVTRPAKKGQPADPAGKATTVAKTGRQRAPKKDALQDVDLSKLPVAVAVGDITATVEEYSGRPVLSIALRGWVGDAPLKILASDAKDLEQVIAELRSQLS